MGPTSFPNHLSLFSSFSYPAVPLCTIMYHYGIILPKNYITSETLPQTFQNETMLCKTLSWNFDLFLSPKQMYVLFVPRTLFLGSTNRVLLQNHVLFPKNLIHINYALPPADFFLPGPPGLFTVKHKVQQVQGTQCFTNHQVLFHFLWP